MKTPLLALILLMLIGASACKKQYTCECTYDLVGSPVVESHDLGKQTKKDAEDECEKLEPPGDVCVVKS